jgi:hypothetical protein
MTAKSYSRQGYQDGFQKRFHAVSMETLPLKVGRFHSPYGGIWEMETHRFWEGNGNETATRNNNKKKGM